MIINIIIFVWGFSFGFIFLFLYILPRQYKSYLAGRKDSNDYYEKLLEEKGLKKNGRWVK